MSKNIILESYNLISENTIADHANAEQQFDQMLNDTYGTFQIWDSTYDAAFIAKRVDKIQYDYQMNLYKEELRN